MPKRIIFRASVRSTLLFACVLGSAEAKDKPCETPDEVFLVPLEAPEKPEFVGGDDYKYQVAVFTWGSMIMEEISKRLRKERICIGELHSLVRLELVPISGTSTARVVKGTSAFARGMDPYQSYPGDVASEFTAYESTLMLSVTGTDYTTSWVSPGVKNIGGFSAGLSGIRGQVEMEADETVDLLFEGFHRWAQDNKDKLYETSQAPAQKP